MTTPDRNALLELIAAGSRLSNIAHNLGQQDCCAEWHEHLNAAWRQWDEARNKQRALATPADQQGVEGEIPPKRREFADAWKQDDVFGWYRAYEPDGEPVDDFWPGKDRPKHWPVTGEGPLSDGVKLYVHPAAPTPAPSTDSTGEK